MFPTNTAKYRYPPDPKTVEDELIYCIVVEKKGEDTGNTMKQQEIFCYSPQIRKTSGCFVMHKSNWKQYNIGDWFACAPEYVRVLDPRDYEEQYLNAIQYIPLHMRIEKQLPYTIVHREKVQIMVEFIRSPAFIAYDCINSRRGLNVHKLVMWKMGMAYVDERKFKVNKDISPTRIYRGIFEFRHSQDGGVNFCSGLKDKYDMALERDTLWELVEIVPYRFEEEAPNGKPIKSRAIKDSKNWTNYISDLEKWSKEYAETIEIRLLKNPPQNPPSKPSNDFRSNGFNRTTNQMPKPAPQIESNNGTRNSTEDSDESSSGPINATTSNEASNETFYDLTNNTLTDNLLNEPIFNDRNTRAVVGRPVDPLHRLNEVIRLKPFHVDGQTNPEYFYVDTETGEKSSSREVLVRKFNSRYQPEPNSDADMSILNRILPNVIHEGFNVNKAVALIPTIQHMAASPNGQRLQSVLSTPAEVHDAYVEILHKDVFQNIVVHVSNDELDFVVDLDHKLLENRNLIHFYYGKRMDGVQLNMDILCWKCLEEIRLQSMKMIVNMHL